MRLCGMSRMHDIYTNTTLMAPTQRRVHSTFFCKNWGGAFVEYIRHDLGPIRCVPIRGRSGVDPGRSMVDSGSS